MTTDALIVNEVFGPTWQGEGPSMGQRAGFVRLGRCNLSCSWCDSRFSWDWERYDPDVELCERSIEAILAELDEMNVNLVVLTGGEPLLQQHRLGPFLRATNERGWRVEVETNGTLVPDEDQGFVDQWNVSPKLDNSGIELGRRYRPEVLRTFEATGRAVFKFVVAYSDDLNEVAAVVDECQLSSVWIMPEGTDAATTISRAQALAPTVLDRGWNLSTRLQILLWGDRRGV